jgi:hypothetical protein
MPPSSSSYADAFAAVVGPRAGIADPEAIFTTTPDGEARKQAQRLHAAIDSGDYDAALDALRAHPEIALARELSCSLINDLCVHAVSEHRRRHLDDAQALATILLREATEAEIQTDVDEVEMLASMAVREILAYPQATAAELRAEIVRIIYSGLANLAIERLRADGLAHLLGSEPTFDDVANWVSQVQRVCAPGLATSNSDLVRSELIASCQNRALAGSVA